jgi:predicted nuclease of predicted toxin-antitoxin system
VGEKTEEEPRLLIDACLTAALPEYLLHHLGIDAVRVDKCLPINATDGAVVAFARQSGRVIATENAEDFRRLANNDPRHPGLIIVAGGVGKARQLELMHAVVERLLADIKMGRTLAGHVYDAAADGTVRRNKLPV